MFPELLLAVGRTTPRPSDKKSQNLAESLDFWVVPGGPGHSGKVREGPGQKLKKVKKLKNFRSVNDFRQISEV